MLKKTNLKSKLSFFCLFLFSKCLPNTHRPSNTLIFDTTYIGCLSETNTKRNAEKIQIESKY